MNSGRAARRLATITWSALLLGAVTVATAALTVSRTPDREAAGLTVGLLVTAMVAVALAASGLTAVLRGRLWSRTSRRVRTITRAATWVLATFVVDLGLLLQLLTAERVWPIVGAAVGLTVLVAARPRD